MDYYEYHGSSCGQISSICDLESGITVKNVTQFLHGCDFYRRSQRQSLVNEIAHIIMYIIAHLIGNSVSIDLGCDCSLDKSRTS